MTALFLGALSFGLGLLLISERTKSFREKLTDIKAEELKEIISDSYKLELDIHDKKYFKNSTDVFGDGILDGERIPVLTITNEDNPFPGYGRLQLENTFVCRPKEEDSTIPSHEKVEEQIFQNINNSLKKSTDGEISSGILVVIHGGSLTIDSKWLDERKIPHLWIEKDKLNEYSNSDSSSRKYGYPRKLGHRTVVFSAKTCPLLHGFRYWSCESFKLI